MPDHLASLLVFTVVIVIFLSSWNSVRNDQDVFYREEKMQEQASRTVAFLVSTPGYPENWEQSGVKVEIPGFASKNLVLEPEKLEEFAEFSDEKQRRLLKARNFNMTLENSSGVIQIGGERMNFGSDYSDADTVVPVKRSVTLNRSGGMKNAELKLILWSR